ncbi:nicotinate-nucleotide adenylyltransferase [Viridibacterium curvum]|uniref:Probable nicotinate-nucleotide adenylyltransferase n=1 Tax=Viridibacterium curvum TaxID=1101404 RepID=A0ABP9QN78_9RHOO
MRADAAGVLGILGGTFDPVHFGHLRLAQEAADCLQLDGVRLIPAGQPRHRGTPGALAADRLAMVRLAAAGVTHFTVDAAEVLSEQPSYTVPTLERLRGELGETQPIVLIVGADAFAGLPRWHRWRELFALAHIGVATRPGYSLEPEQLAPELAAEFANRSATPEALRGAAGGCIVPFSMTPLEISATAIRALIGARRTPRFLVPDEVLDYIEAHSLYRQAP